MESDDKIKSGLWVPGSPLVIPSFGSFHKTSSYIQGRISLEYVKWGAWATRWWGKAYWYPGVITPPLPAGERGCHRRLPEASACYVGRNGQQHPWDTVWGKKKIKKGNREIMHVNMLPRDSKTYLSLTVASMTPSLTLLKRKVFSQWAVSVSVCIRVATICVCNTGPAQIRLERKEPQS